MKIQYKINLIVVILVITFWVVHAYFDSLLSTDGVTFLESCFNPGVENLMIRGFVTLLLLIFSAFAERMVRVINNMAKDIKDHQERLDETIIKHQLETKDRLRTLKELEQLAETDPLTSALNRRKFKEMLQYETERNHRYQINLSLIMCDIDHFKRINDQFGHDVGDKALKVFSKNISEHIRDIDIFARWGGEEFMILMPNTAADNAYSVAEKLRKLIEATAVEGLDTFTASFGVTAFRASDTIDTFIKRTDAALYRAKKGGRNNVVVIA